LSNGELWDREMTMAEFKAMDPALQKKRIDTALRRKVDLLQGWASSGVPEGVNWRDLAGSRTKMRAWYDPAKGLWSWSDDVPDQPTGRNRKVMARWKTARERLQKSAPPPKPLSIVEKLQLTVRSLEKQNTQLIADKAWLEEELRQRPPKKSR
jgi:hypothetical protein